MRSYKFSTVFVTVYLAIYTVLLQLNAPVGLLMLMFSVSPFLVIWLAYTILKYAPFKGRELAKNEEWGYTDHMKEQAQR